MSKFKVQVSITEVEEAVIVKDQYRNETITPASETEILKGTYVIPASADVLPIQQVTDFLSRLSGGGL
jgi:hypothetical protein